MKGFFKALGIITAFFAAIVGALAIVDRFLNKNAIKGEYLDCSEDITEE
ncbi:MAG: hypothetical protein J5852_00460 [Clostridia bacterium]|nr:hypothetical protein [Clostridia bacterium]